MSRRSTVLFLLLSLSSLEAAARASLPRMDEMMPLLSDLASRGSYGIADTEQAAFIVEDAEGELRCVLWSFSADFQRASHTGAIPENVVAIAHTHPRCCRDVSAHDRREAQRLGIAVIAVSMGTLSSVDESGRPADSRSGISWRRHANPEKRCSE